MSRITATPSGSARTCLLRLATKLAWRSASDSASNLRMSCSPILSLHTGRDGRRGQGYWAIENPPLIRNATTPMMMPVMSAADNVNLFVQRCEPSFIATSTEFMFWAFTAPFLAARCCCAVTRTLIESSRLYCWKSKRAAPRVPPLVNVRSTAGCVFMCAAPNAANFLSECSEVRLHPLRTSPFHPPHRMAKPACSNEGVLRFALIGYSKTARSSSVSRVHT